MTAQELISLLEHFDHDEQIVFEDWKGDTTSITKLTFSFVTIDGAESDGRKIILT